MREAAADAREAAADNREATVDQWLLENDLIDADQAAARQEARAERARRRSEREAERAKRTAAHDESFEHLWQHSDPADYPLAQQFAELATTLFAAGSVSGVLDHLVVSAARVIRGADAVSVTLQRDGAYTTPAYHGELAYELDQLQYQHEQGPCLDSVAASGEAYSACADLAGQAPWPAFAPAAAAAGGRAVLAFGMFPDPSVSLPRLGSLNLYARSPAAFESGDREVGMVLAAHAGVALASSSASSEAEVRTANLERAMESRDVIGQAKGILMERHKLSPGQAFDTLRDASNRLNTKLADLARQLSETGQAPLPRR